MFIIPILALTAGCGLEPTEMSEPNEMQKGPGLFTGDKGSFEVLGK